MTLPGKRHCFATKGLNSLRLDPFSVNQGRKEPPEDPWDQVHTQTARVIMQWPLMQMVKVQMIQCPLIPGKNELQNGVDKAPTTK